MKSALFWAAYLNHVLAEIYDSYRFWKESQVKPLDTIVGKAESLQIAKNKEHFIDVLQVVVIKMKGFKIL